MILLAVSVHRLPLLLTLFTFAFLMTLSAYAEATVYLKESFAEDEQTIKSGASMGF